MSVDKKLRVIAINAFFVVLFVIVFTILCLICITLYQSTQTGPCAGKGGVSGILSGIEHMYCANGEMIR